MTKTLRFALAMTALLSAAADGQTATVGVSTPKADVTVTTDEAQQREEVKSMTATTGISAGFSVDLDPNG